MTDHDELQPIAPNYASRSAVYGRTERSDFGLQLSKQPDVVFVGDSIVSDWCQEHPDFFRRNNFAARGVCGETSLDVAKRFGADAVSSGASVVVVLCGINDFGASSVDPVAGVLRNVARMSDEALLAGLPLVVCSLLPCAAIPWGPRIEGLAAQVAAVNAALRSLATERRFVVADCHAAMVAPDGGMSRELSLDGLHPNSAGFCVMETVVTKVLARITQRTNPYYVTPFPSVGGFGGSRDAVQG